MHSQSVCVLFFIALLLAGCTLNKTITLYDKDHLKLDTPIVMKLPVEIDVVYYNGKNTRFIAPYQPIVEYLLAPGQQTIGLRYSDIYTNSENDEQTVKSNIVFLQFQAQPNKVYTTHFLRPVNLQAAEEFAGNFHLKLFDGRQLVAESVPQNEEVASGLSSLFGLEPAEVNTEHNEQEQKSPLHQLKYWWEQASSADKEAFERWRKTH